MTISMSFDCEFKFVEAKERQRTIPREKEREKLTKYLLKIVIFSVDYICHKTFQS